jgi:hypothetical protein
MQAWPIELGDIPGWVGAGLGAVALYAQWRTSRHNDRLALTIETAFSPTIAEYLSQPSLTFYLTIINKGRDVAIHSASISPDGSTWFPLTHSGSDPHIPPLAYIGRHRRISLVSYSATHDPPGVRQLSHCCRYHVVVESGEAFSGTFTPFTSDPTWQSAFSMFHETSGDAL